MDSGNSCNMQFSGGGDEEYDLRPPPPAGSNISPFFNSTAEGGYFGTSITNQPTTFFDSRSHNNLTGPFSQPLPAANQNPNNTPYNSLDLPWSRGPISEPNNYSHLGNFTDLASSSWPSQALLGSQGLNNQGPSPVSLGPTDGTAQRVSPSPQPDQINTSAIKNPKKRTRASRRAPTTFLATDTANFRQMVEELTGVPNPPFSCASPYSRRPDLFGSGPTMRAAGNLDTIGGALHHPLRPSAQKVQLSPFVSSSPSWLTSNMIDVRGIGPSTSISRNTNGSSANSIAGTAANNFSSTTNSFQLRSDIRLEKQPQNILNMQNPILSFQSILNSTLPAINNPLGTAPIFNAKSKGSSSINPSLDELGSLNHQPVNSNNLGSGGFSIQKISDNLARWRDGGTRNDQEHLGSLNGNHDSYKLNTSSIPGSDFLPEKRF